MEPPQNPAGAFVPEDGYGPDRRAEFIAALADAPADTAQVAWVCRRHGWLREP
ncbi:MAG TPA: hypothetical protein VGF55_00735 [Gemmataceae bacterium]|jgi:hypothetical protein